MTKTVAKERGLLMSGPMALAAYRVIVHTEHCNGCDEPLAFVCDTCGRHVGACMGCDDEMPETCTDCWFDERTKNADQSRD